MRKYVLILSLLALIIGCQQADQSLIQPKQANGISVQEGRLTFSSPAHFAASVVDVENGKLNVIDNKLANFDYKSYKSALNGLTIDPSQSVLGIAGFQILLNANREIKIGDKVYNVDKDVTKIYSIAGQLIETAPNKIEVFDRQDRQFVEMNSKVNARTVNQWSYFPIAGPIPYQPSPYQIADRFLRATSFWFVYYQYQWQLQRIGGGSVMNATYWQINGVFCIPCMNIYPPSQTVYNNIWTGTITIGSNAYDYEANYGYALDVQSSIQLADYPPVFSWDSHVP
jgi:hypothetical protein